MQAHESDEMVKELQSCSIKPNMCHVLRVDAQWILSFLHTWTAEFGVNIEDELIHKRSERQEDSTQRDMIQLRHIWMYCDFQKK